MIQSENLCLVLGIDDCLLAKWEIKIWFLKHIQKKNGLTETHTYRYKMIDSTILASINGIGQRKLCIHWDYVAFPPRTRQKFQQYLAIPGTHI